MIKESKCILCEKEARISGVSGKDAAFIECEKCGNYVLASPELFEKAYIHMPREKRAMLSAYTRELYELEEEPPELEDPDTLEEIIAGYENKTFDEKLENLIWYLRKKSKEFSDSVSWDAEKDYPITYSLSPQGFTKIRDLSIEKGFVEWPARGTGLKLTEEGWRLSTEIIKKKVKTKK